MLKVIQVNGNVFSSNMYILFDESTFGCWVVDVGDFESLRQQIPSRAVVKGLFLTHGHFDHIAGINEFHRAYPDAAVYTSPYGKEQLYSDKKNLSLYHEQSCVFEGNGDVIRVLDADSVVGLTDTESMKVVETSGHCRSCLTFYTDRYIFTGDSYIPGVPVVTKLPTGNRAEAARSLEVIGSLIDGRTVCPGHHIP